MPTVQISGVAAGVPFLAVPPASGPTPTTPVVLAWHLMDAPRTEAAFAAAVPLDGLDAWRIYLGLPMCGSRSLAGGDEELMRLGYEDAVLNLQGPVSEQAAGEFGAAFAELRTQLDLGAGPVGLLGGSMGAAVAQLVIVEGDVKVNAAVLVSPLIRLHPIVEAAARYFDISYAWSEQSRRIARRLDFVARADEIATRGQPAMLLVVGAQDDSGGVREPAEQLLQALASRYADPDRIELVAIEGMAHALAEDTGVEPAPQTAHAAEVDRHAVRWFQQHLAAG